MVTYGDGIADINIKKLVAFHKKQGTVGTITGVHPYSKYGVVEINERTNLVVNFTEKPLLRHYVSGGFIVLNRKAFDYFDKGPMENSLVKMVKKNQLSIYKHEGFFGAIDTYREMKELNELWRKKRPWAVWEK